MTFRSCLVACVLVLLFGGAVSAGDPDPYGRIPRLFGVFTPVPGVWAEYEVTEKDSGRRTRMRMAVVGKEGDAYWYEVVNHAPEGRNVVKMLVRGNPNDPDNIERLILKSGDNPAAEMPRDFVAMGRKMAVHMFERRSGVAGSDPDQLRVEKVGEGPVTVPAGTFQATLQRIVDAQGQVLATYHFLPDILPFGVVASETRHTTMALLAYGRDARSEITETPVPMAAPPGMPQGMPRGLPPGMKLPGGQAD
ncbi:MAG: hypothetical protein Kow0092_30150 [Deferrisomatales bacterium]